MCGISAFSGKYPFDTDKIKMLMLYNQARGAHSSGYYNHYTKQHVNARLVKKSGPTAQNLLPKFNAIPSEMFIGHTRFATMGKTEDVAGAHPFIYNTTVGVHNGIIKNYQDIVKEYELEDITVDSQVIFNAIAKSNTFNVLSQLEGAYAVVFTDTDDENSSMFIARNKERPLFRGTIVKDNSIGMYISSIKESLEAIGCENIKEFKEDYLYEIKQGCIISTTKIVSKPILKPLPLVENSIKTVISETTYYKGAAAYKTILYSDGSKDDYRAGTSISSRIKDVYVIRDNKRFIRTLYGDDSYTEQFLEYDIKPTIEHDDIMLSLTADEAAVLYNLHAIVETIRTILTTNKSDAIRYNGILEWNEDHEEMLSELELIMPEYEELIYDFTTEEK
jgi:glucosamine 6-phosphate synthetase-like amidotransferase/phosphosugar isomerase protein